MPGAGGGRVERARVKRGATTAVEGFKPITFLCYKRPSQHRGPEPTAGNANCLSDTITDFQVGLA